jgi:uncharacterized protein (UPF0335 family)
MPIRNAQTDDEMLDDSDDAIARQLANSNSPAAEELRKVIERCERLEEEKKGIADDIKDVMAEAKGRGYDPKVIRRILGIRKRKKEEWEQEEGVLETYLSALGMI